MNIKAISLFTAMIGAALQAQSFAYGQRTLDGATSRSRVRMTKKGQCHQRNAAGTKLARMASLGNLTKHHPSAVDSHFAELTAKRHAAEQARRKRVAEHMVTTKGKRHASIVF